MRAFAICRDVVLFKGLLSVMRASRGRKEKA